MCKKWLLRKSLGSVKRLFAFSSGWEFRSNRKVKDRLFRELFAKDKEALLQLYNALHGTDYQNEEDLEVITMDNVLYMGMKNDLAYMLIGTINLYEHQSTYNPNMPLRFLHYISQEYLRYVDYTEQNIYGSTQVKLPTPHFVVFYNGEKDMPDEKLLKLSDAYEVTEEEKSLEVVVRMININYGRNKELMQGCSKLEEYAFFIHQVRLNLQKGMKRKKAVDEAIFYCIEHGVMAEFLKKHRFKARGNVLFEYDENWHMYMERRDARAEGREEGRAEALTELCQDWNVSREDTIQKVSEKLNISESKAEELVEKYWRGMP